MDSRRTHESGQWRLGLESGGSAAPHTAPISLPPPGDAAGARLERPLLVITSEILGWVTVGLFALASRLWMLGARPLDPHEAQAAWSELGALSHPILLLRGSPESAALPLRLFESAAFAALGAGDFAARIGFAGFGLILIASAFALRRQVGRAGALGVAAMLALSPTIAYFSRSASPVLPAVALEVAALILLLELCRRPSIARAAAAAAVAGLALALDPSAFVTAILLAATMAIVGAVRAAVSAHPMLGVRVWWERRSGLLAIFVVIMIGVWIVSAPEFISRNSIAPIIDALRADIRGPGTAGFRPGLDFYLPILALYEFLIAAAALVGAIAVLTLRVRSLVGVAALVWSALAVCFWLWTPVRAPALALQMLAPMALLGGFAIEFLYRLRAWKLIRYGILALAILTAFVQIRNDFVFCAPDASEAPWARHLLLFWDAPATTFQTLINSSRVMEATAGGDRTVFFAEDSPVLRWYLRSLRPVAKIDEAVVIVGDVKAGSFSGENDASVRRFVLAQAWRPRWNQISWPKDLECILDGRIWGEIETTGARILIRPLNSTVSTVILAPGPLNPPNDLSPGVPSSVP